MPQEKKSSFDSPASKTDRSKRTDQPKKGKKSSSPLSSKDNAVVGKESISKGEISNNVVSDSQSPAPNLRNTPTSSPNQATNQS